MRQAILRELAVESLRGATELESHLRQDLIQAAARENITLFEFIRERLLLKAGISTVGVLMTLCERRVEAAPLINAGRAGSEGATSSADSGSKFAA